MKMFNSTRLHVLLLLLLSLFTAIYVQRPILSDYYSFDGDSSHIIYWFNSISLEKVNSNENDLMSKYASWSVSAGGKALYLLGAFFFDPVILVKIIPLITSTLCVLFMYLIGKIIRGHGCGLISGISFLYIGWFFRYRQMFGSADTEEISLLLTVIFIYFLLKEKYRIISAILVLQAVVYPPLFFLCSLTIFGISALESKGKLITYFRNNRKKLLLLAFVILIGTAFLFLKYVSNEPDFMGRPLVPSEVKEIEEFRPGGRQWVLDEPDTILSRAMSQMTGIGLDAPKKFMLAVILLLLFLPVLPGAKKRALLLKMRPLWVFLFSGAILAIIANLVMFKLFEPSRYIQNPLNIFLITFISLFISSIYTYWNYKGKTFAAKSIVVSYVLLFAFVAVPNFGCHAESYSELKPAAEFFSSLPDNIFIAGHPQSMNVVGMYSAKRTFLTYKLSGEVYWIDYYKEMTKRTKEFFKAYYTEDIAQFVSFCETYGITHMVVVNYHFFEDYVRTGRFYFRPFDDYIRKLVEDKPCFFLTRIPEKYVVFKSPALFIVDCSRLLKEMSG